MEDTAKHLSGAQSPVGRELAVSTSDGSSGVPALSGPQRLAEKRMLINAIDSDPSLLHHSGDTSEHYLFFFYGSLMDPDVLETVTGNPEEPILLDAWVEGYEMRMWQGIYPTLLPLQDAENGLGHAEDIMNTHSSKTSPQSSSRASKIRGKAWYASTVDQCLALQSYETSAYAPSDCQIHVRRSSNETEEDVVAGLTFTWARGLSDKELKEGVFSLEHWIKEIKPVVWH